MPDAAIVQVANETGQRENGGAWDTMFEGPKIQTRAIVSEFRNDQSGAGRAALGVSQHLRAGNPHRAEANAVPVGATPLGEAQGNSQLRSQSFIVDNYPPGTREVWVEQGTLLGYQGEYTGSSIMPVGLHVHFSIVKSEPDGSFKNESQTGNTLDPSPYFGMELNIKTKPERPIQCRE